jgi:hypothetical protein
MDAEEIGDVFFKDVEHQRLRGTVAEQQDTWTWTVAGAQAAIAWLERWINEQKHKPEAGCARTDQGPQRTRRPTRVEP